MTCALIVWTCAKTVNRCDFFLFNEDAAPREEAAILFPNRDAGKTPQKDLRHNMYPPGPSSSKGRQRNDPSPIPWSESEDEGIDEFIPKTPVKTPRTTGFASPGQGGPATAMRNMAMNTPNTAEGSRRAYKFQQAMNTPPVPRPNFGQAPDTPKTPSAHRSNPNPQVMTTPSSNMQSAMPQTPVTPGSDKPIDLVTDVSTILSRAGISLDDQTQTELENLLSKAMRKTQGYVKAQVLPWNMLVHETLLTCILII